MSGLLTFMLKKVVGHSEKRARDVMQKEQEIKQAQELLDFLREQGWQDAITAGEESESDIPLDGLKLMVIALQEYQQKRVEEVERI